MKGCEMQEEYRQWKLLVSMVILVAFLLPIGLIPFLPFLVYRTICQIHINIKSLDVILIPLGTPSILTMCEQVDIRFVLEFGQNFDLDKFHSLVQQNLPSQFKYSIGTFGGLAAFRRFKSEFRLEDHIQIKQSLPANGFRENVQKIATNLDPLQEDRPMWQFIVIPEETEEEEEENGEKKGRTSVIFRIFHGYTDVVGVYVFLLTLSDTKFSTRTYVDMFSKTSHVTRPHWLYAGWGFLKIVFNLLAIIEAGALSWFEFKDKKKERKAESKQGIVTSIADIDLKRVVKIKDVCATRMFPVLTAAATASFRKMCPNSNFLAHYPVTYYGRSAEKPENSLTACAFVVEAEDQFNSSMRDKVKKLEDAIEDAKYMSLFLDFAAITLGGFTGPILKVLMRPTWAVLSHTSSPFTKQSISIAGSELNYFYRFLNANITYVAFVTYNGKMVSSISSPAALMSPEDVQLLNREICGEMDSMFSLATKLQ